MEYALRILLTNDDGYTGEGLLELKRILEKKHEVWVVAPDKNRSAISHGITMYEPLCIKQIDTNFFTCSGVPVDCFMNAVRGIMPYAPDVVISGINKGANLGTDLVYSGTVAAARQAALVGMKGIAVSLTGGNYDGKSPDGLPPSNGWQFTALADFVSNNLSNLCKMCADDIFVNINAKSSTKYKGTCLTVLSKRDYNDSMELYETPTGQKYSFFVGGDVTSTGPKNCDFYAVEDGYIAISRVYAQPICADIQDYNDLSFVL